MKTAFLLSFLFVLLTFTSCMLPSKMDKSVSKFYENSHAKTVIHNTDVLSLNTDKLPYIENFNESKFRYFLFVPLLVYNFSGEKIKCQINPKIYGNYISTNLYQFMEDPVNASSKKKVEIEFEHIPYQIYHRFHSHLVFFFHLNIGLNSKTQLVTSPEDSLTARYVIRDSSDKILKTEHVKIELAPFFSRKDKEKRREEFIYTYMIGHDYRMKLLCSKLTDKIINDLTN